MPQEKTFEKLRIEAIVRRVEGSIVELNKINLTNLSLEEVDIFNKSISKL